MRSSPKLKPGIWDALVALVVLVMAVGCAFAVWTGGSAGSGAPEAVVRMNEDGTDTEIRMALDMIKSNVFSLLEPGLFDPILRSLIDYNDYYMLLADLKSYCEAQDRVDAAYRDAKTWNRMSLVNIARSGRFSSDRAVLEYAEKIWNIKPVKF